MLQKETPWLHFEQFKASDGSQNPIPEEEVTATWNSSCNSYYANSWVALDEGDNDGTWAGGIVDQVDFQGDSDIKKSDGGHQGDDAAEFAVEQ